MAYHDAEWGAPVHDDARLFEMLTLEGAQAGLSWETILRKRARYRVVFDGFEIDRVARFTAKRIEAILADPGVVRHRGKIESVVSNARALQRLRETHGSFDAYAWSFTGGQPLREKRARQGDVPASTPLSMAISKDLRARGFRFVGETIVYSFMQAVGIVNDHLIFCAWRDRPAG